MLVPLCPGERVLKVNWEDVADQRTVLVPHSTDASGQRVAVRLTDLPKPTNSSLISVETTRRIRVTEDLLRRVPMVSTGKGMVRGKNQDAETFLRTPSHCKQSG